MATLLPTLTITAAIATPLTTASWRFRERGPRNLCVEAIFTYGSGGTTVDAYVQTSFDGGTTWVDIFNFHPTTASLSSIVNLSCLTPVTTVYPPTDGTLASNTVKDGVLGDLLRVKYKSAGTYAGGTTLLIVASSAQYLAQHPA